MDIWGEPENVDTGRPLSEEEDLVLRLLARGKSFKEIAAFIGVPLNNLNRRMETTRRKLGARTTIQAMFVWAAIRANGKALSIVERKLLDRAEGVTEGCE